MPRSETCMFCFVCVCVRQTERERERERASIHFSGSQTFCISAFHTWSFWMFFPPLLPGPFVPYLFCILGVLYLTSLILLLLYETAQFLTRILASGPHKLSHGNHLLKVCLLFLLDVLARVVIRSLIKPLISGFHTMLWTEFCHVHTFLHFVDTDRYKNHFLIKTVSHKLSACHWQFLDWTFSLHTTD